MLGELYFRDEADETRKLVEGSEEEPSACKNACHRVHTDFKEKGKDEESERGMSV